MKAEVSYLHSDGVVRSYACSFKKIVVTLFVNLMKFIFKCLKFIVTDMRLDIFFMKNLNFFFVNLGL